jgi:hypothetical protein
MTTIRGAGEANGIFYPRSCKLPSMVLKCLVSPEHADSSPKLPFGETTTGVYGLYMAVDIVACMGRNPTRMLEKS